jgi:ATP-binding cassette, subfamily B, bacterial IrtA/YbtP
MSTLKRLQHYMGGRRGLLPGALTLSAVSALLGMTPLILIWQIVHELLAPEAANPDAFIQTSAWWALGTAVASVVIYFAALSLSHLAAFRAETNMRRESMRRIVAMPLGFFDRNTSGRMRKVVDDNAGITHMFLAHQMPDLAASLAVPVIALTLIFVFDWRLGLATLVPIIAAMVLMSFMMGKRGRHFMKTYMDSLEEMNAEAVEYVRGIPVVKVFQQTVFSFKNFLGSIVRYKEMVHRYTMMWEKPMAAYIVIIHGFAYFLIPVGVLLIAHGSATTPMIINLFFYILLTPVFAQSIMRSMFLSQALGQAKEAVDRVDDLLKVAPLPLSEKPKAVTGYDIEFRQVTFSYDGSDSKAVDNVSFRVPAGHTYAMVGPSGGGKTTLARLVPRFWDVDYGQALIGGTDVRDLDPDSLMKNICFVFQNNRLFKTSLLENIRFGNPLATAEAIERAVDHAQCRDTIDRLPEGLDTRIGAEGTFLSGGEQQRIALARAFIKDAPIVVLDEATAFTDPENEHLIQQALAELAKGKTVLMIAHRLSSVVNADRILVIDRGTVVEQGSHTELLGLGGLYARMWREYRQAVHWTLKDESASLTEPEVRHA